MNLRNTTFQKSLVTQSGENLNAAMRSVMYDAEQQIRAGSTARSIARQRPQTPRFGDTTTRLTPNGIAIAYEDGKGGRREGQLASDSMNQMPYQSASGVPSVLQFPNDGDWGWYLDTATNLLYFCRNVGGTVHASVAPASGSIPQMVKLDADLSPTGSTSLSDATGMSFELLPDVYYSYRFNVLYRSAAITTGVGFALSFSSSTFFTGNVRIGGFAGAGANADYLGTIISSNDTVLSSATITANTTYLAEITGAILVTAATTLQLRQRSEVAASNITVKQGTHAFLWAIS